MSAARVEHLQLAERIDQEHRVARRRHGARAALRMRHATLAQQCTHRIEALRVTRHQQQQRIGMAGTHGCVRRQCGFFFTFVRATGDPDRPPLAPLLAHGATGIDGRGGDLKVVLDVAGHLHAARCGTDRAKPVGVGLRLRTDQDAVRQRIAEQRGHAPVTIDGPRRNPCAAEQQRNPPLSELVVQGRPDLGLEDDHRLRRNPVKETTDRAGQVVRQVADLHALLEQRPRPLRASRRDRGEHDRQRRIPALQFADESSRRLHLAHRHGMNPDGSRSRRSLHEAEPLPQSTPVLRIEQRFPHFVRDHQGCDEIDQQDVQQSHGVCSACPGARQQRLPVRRR